MKLRIDHNYLEEQFADYPAILSDVMDVIGRGDFTLGKEVELFEEEFAKMIGVKHAIGVGNGTDALFLAMKAMGYDPQGYGWENRPFEVITTPYSFYSTTAIISHAGLHPVYVDVGKDFNINPELIEAAITEATVGILPVHWAGLPCDMDKIMEIARKHNLWVIEDCAHAPGSVYKGKKCGSIGNIGTFSLHPLKNVNVWGDGGVITTEDDLIYTWLRRARNHGMVDRNTCVFWGWNSRLDTIQAVVGRHVLSGISSITAHRRMNAKILDKLLEGHHRRYFLKQLCR